MKKSNSTKKALGAFKKLGAVALITATIFFVACNQTGNTGGGGESTPKHAITFGVEGGNGTLKAKAYGVAETTTSPINVEEGKAVIFTATANDGYRVKGWTLDGNAVNGTAETYTLAVTQPATVKVSFELIPQAILTLSPGILTIKVTAKTADGSAITVEGCKETTLASEAETTLTATGTTVILKGNITELDCSGDYYNIGSLTALNVQGLTSLQELDCQVNRLTSLNVQGLTALQKLYCSYNQLPELNVQGLTALQKLDCFDNKLTALNVQGCTALKKLYCHLNKLNAQAMKEILNALPAREAGDNAEALLYAEKTGETEGNCKDFSQPAELKTAFDGAKKRNWKLRKNDASGSLEDL